MGERLSFTYKDAPIYLNTYAIDNGGEFGPKFIYRIVEILGECRSNNEQRIISGVSHGPSIMTNPNEFNWRIVKFLAKHNFNKFPPPLAAS